jgi:hypothetical protein
MRLDPGMMGTMLLTVPVPVHGMDLFLLEVC